MAREQLLKCMLVVGGEKAKAGPSRRAGHALGHRRLRLGHSWTWADKATDTAPPPGVHTGDRGRTEDQRAYGDEDASCQDGVDPERRLLCVRAWPAPRDSGPGQFLRTGGDRTGGA